VTCTVACLNILTYKLLSLSKGKNLGSCVYNIQIRYYFMIHNLRETWPYPNWLWSPPSLLSNWCQGLSAWG